MKKKLCFISLLGLGISSLINAQERKVGINVPDPQETLDVGGTVRLKKPGAAKANAIPLGVTTSGKVVAYDFNQFAGLFETKTLKITTGRNGVRTGVDTGISKENKQVIITSAVVRRKGTVDKTPIFKMATVEDGQDGGTSNAITLSYVKKGKVVPNRKSGFIQGTLTNRPNTPEARNPLLYSPPYAFVYRADSDNNWQIDVGVAYSEDIQNTQLEWTVELLVIDNSLASFINDRVYTVGADSRTLQKVSL